MTDASNPRKSPKRRARTASAGTREAVLMAALPHVPFEGFTEKVLKRAAADAGVSQDAVTRLFPQGALSLVEAFSEWADEEMTRQLTRMKLADLKVRERIAAAVKTRIAVLRPHKEAARRAAAFLMLPPHAATGMKLLYRTVDAIWRGIGDTSTDFNFYTKRAILAGVYSTTLMRWFSDTSKDDEITGAFLDRRIGDVMRFEKFKAEIRERAGKLPTLSDILNPRPAARRPKAKAG
jgi:ubiquinone biosynthesis protein COQ9